MEFIATTKLTLAFIAATTLPLKIEGLKMILQAELTVSQTTKI
jgi:hypothetical protein